MGRIRGKRNRDQDRYWHERRKASQSGMVGAAEVSFCDKCGLASLASELVTGWCQRCLTAWKATADPVMLAQAGAGYAPKSCLPAPSDKDVQRILNSIAEPKVDKEFIPLVLFRGGSSIGRMQALWNFCKTMELLELKTTGEALRLSAASHDLAHRCGLHAPVQRSTLQSFFSRVFYAQEFKPIQRDKHLYEYMRWFKESNGMWTFKLTPISTVAERSRRAWRRFPKLSFKPLTEHWPFLHKEAARDHLHIMMVDSLVPKGIPEQWRQDMCQDLFVAILSGEMTPDELERDSKWYIKQVWKNHPYKYGALSLDAPIPKADGKGGTVTILDVLADKSFDDHSACSDGHVHHFEAEFEPRSLGTLGDLLRDKNNGVAIPDLQMEHPYEMDEEVFDVYRDEVLRGRR